MAYGVTVPETVTLIRWNHWTFLRCKIVVVVAGAWDLDLGLGKFIPNVSNTARGCLSAVWACVVRNENFEFSSLFFCLFSSVQCYSWWRCRLIEKVLRCWCLGSNTKVSRWVPRIRGLWELWDRGSIVKKGFWINRVVVKQMFDLLCRFSSFNSLHNFSFIFDFNIDRQERGWLRYKDKNESLIKFWKEIRISWLMRPAILVPVDWWGLWSWWDAF